MRTIRTYAAASSGAAILALTSIIAAAPPAAAHTPAISASCDGVSLRGTAYDAGQANRWSVTINGQTQTGTFGVSFAQTFPVPQDGATTTWSATIEGHDGKYRGSQSGTVGPCGEKPRPPQPKDESREREREQVRCEDRTIDTVREQSTRSTTFDPASWTWKPTAWTDWTPIGTVSRPATVEDCADGPKPPAVEEVESSTEQECEDTERTIERTTSTWDFTLDWSTGEWVKDAKPTVVTTTTTEAVDPVPCPGPPAPPEPENPTSETPPAAHTREAVSAASPMRPGSAVLPNTGGTGLEPLVAGALALAGGAALVLHGGLRRRGEQSS